MTRGDLEIVEAVRGGDTEAYRHLVERHQDTVYAFLLRLLGDPLQAEEVAQDAFVRAWRALEGFRGEARFSTWVVQIALHAARDHLRRRRRHAVLPLDGLSEKDGTSPILRETRPDFDPLVGVSERELSARVASALDRLPDDYRQAFVLHHVEEMGYPEIARLTGISEGALRVRVHRARKLLLEALVDEPRAARAAPVKGER